MSLRDLLDRTRDALSRARRFRFLPHFAAIALLYVVAGHFNVWPRDWIGNALRFEFATPTATSGDEPHYLIVVHSILYDHDVRIDPDFPRIKAGGYQAGIAWVGRDIGGHSLLVNVATGKNVTCSYACTDNDAAALGAPLDDLVQVPAHPVAYPAFLALLLAPFSPSPDHVEALVGEIEIVIAIAVVFLTYLAARKSGQSERAALGSTLLLALATPWLVYDRSYFSEPAIGLFLVLGFVAMRFERYALAGLAIAVAMAMKPVFVVFGFAWIAERLLARRVRDAAWLTGVIGACGVALLVFNLTVLHNLMSSGAIPWSMPKNLDPLIDTFFVRDHGLIPFIPWSFLPFAWGAYSARPRVAEGEGLLSLDARRQLVFPMFLCLASFAAMPWGPGYCYGPRYWVPLMPTFAILAVDFAVAGRRWRRALLGVLGAVSMLWAVTSVVQYHWLFSRLPSESITGPLFGSTKPR